MNRWVLLGAGGQLGSDIREMFSIHGGSVQLIPVFRKDLDVADWRHISDYLRTLHPFDVLVNCTAFHQTDQCEMNPLQAFSVNGAAVGEMAKYCNRTGSVLIHFSTDYVFDGRKTTPYREEDPTGPLNVYGVSKVAGEQMIRAYHDRFFIFRVSSLFGRAGSGGKGGNFVETMLRLAAGKKEIKVVADQVMSPTHTWDVAFMLREIAKQGFDEYGTYHCSGTGQCSWYEFAETIFSMCQKEVKLRPVSSRDYPSLVKRPDYSVLDNGKLNSVYEMPQWQKSLADYLRMKNHIQIR